jgi:hypothetical protein
MKTLLILLVCTLSVLLRAAIPELIEVTAKDGKTPQPMAKSSAALDKVHAILKRDIAAENEKGIFRLYGHVEAHLPEGLLVRGEETKVVPEFSQFAGVVLLTGFPDADKAVDGSTHLILCVKKDGVFNYKTEDGGKHRVPRLAYHGPPVDSEELKAANRAEREAREAEFKALEAQTQKLQKAGRR